MILGALCVMKPGLMWMPVLCAVNLATLDSVSDILMLCNTLFSNQVAIAILVQLLHACPVSDLIACNSCSTFFIHCRCYCILQSSLGPRECFICCE